MSTTGWPTHTKVRLDVDNDHWPVATRVAWIIARPEYADCTLDVIPVRSEQTGVVGGYQINHGECHVGRVDARVLPACIHKIALLGPDIPYLIAAIENDPQTRYWHRRERVLDKLRGLVTEAPNG